MATDDNIGMQVAWSILPRGLYNGDIGQALGTGFLAQVV